ncbi:LysR family transcriptional regulator [Pseudooctadecabacter jejudonensis]|uniref:HTH-type transcriptional regulator GltC n=1 Tax=Pseudooctadecabacter jejudonensis TaxID=1391910 RepID=A0A1Y5R966_9RHOB|nr:LysR family transcriptional regulator [Pseudooctadecabacter jejudonensis]SLN12083.1 HTH-type transcriptional regulator GltC [Pseudooctadecabacter jejudonensis]
MDRWDDMRVFLAVARAESLSRAAPVLKMDAATVGRRISRLEQGMGAALFAKSQQGYALTDLGARMLAHVEAAEAAMSQAADEVQGTQGGLTGQIRIGAPDGAANYLLPQVCATIAAQNPDLEIQILALPRVVNLSKREADMAVTVSPPDAGRLVVQKVTDYRLHLAARADIANKIATRADLRDVPFVGYIPDMIFDKELDYLGNLASSGVQVASNSVAVQAMALRAGAGVGIVHDFALPMMPEVRRVLTQEVSLVRSFYLVRHQSDRRSERLTRFAEAVTAGVRAQVAQLEGAVA